MIPWRKNIPPKICKKSLVSASDGTSKNLELFYIFKIIYDCTKAYSWIIKKHYSDFIYLSKSLKNLFRQGHLSEDYSFKLEDTFKISSLEQKFYLLEQYLISLSNSPEICSNPAFWEFLEVSALSFDGTSSKRKEGYVMKRTGGRINNEKLCCNISKHFKRLQKRWIIIKDNMIGYLTNNTKEILHEVLMFRGKFTVASGAEDTGYEDGVLLITNRRNLLFRAGSIISMTEWVNAIKEAYNKSEWLNNNHRFDSSFQVRIENNATWFVDGEEYFSEVYNSLLNAKREVFISDWWLSPELYLKRPSVDYPKSSLIEVLGGLADRGILIYVHLYKEVSFALSLNSMYTKKVLSNRSPNIKVVRHPHRTVVGSQFLWSHHEKIICIDQVIAFIGGLDLCFGRMDNSNHLLTDTKEPYLWNGIDYSNVRVADFTDVENHTRDSVDRHLVPRMPWHDVAVKINGKAAFDVALHFIELWNHVMTDITSDYWKNKDLIQPHRESFRESIHFDTILQFNQEDSQKNTLAHFSSNASSSKSFHFSKINATALDILVDDDVFHAEPVKLVSAQTKAWDSDNRISLDSLKKVLTSKTEDREYFEDLDEITFKNEIEADIQQGDEFWARNLLLPKFGQSNKTGACKCQIVRSAGPWSLGLDKAEHSIHSAYLHMIDRANHFIYIENQFFISSTAGKPVKNNIAMALIERIKIAAGEKKPFKVIVLMPLLPGFEGKIESSSLLKAQLHWEYSTICRGIASMIEQLRNDQNIENPDDYISFYGLRSHSLLNGVPVTEIVYIHSKLMIIDDKTVIIGSANINDRSMLGHRDSEIAVVIRDKKKIDSVLGGQTVTVSEFAYSLRMRLFKEFTGCEDEEVLRDPLSGEFLKFWTTIADNNTVIFRHVFRCLPDNEVERIDQISEYEEKKCLYEYEKLNVCIKGFLVQFPLKFLKDESLKISIFNKEYLLPEENFV